MRYMYLVAAVLMSSCVYSSSSPPVNKARVETDERSGPQESKRTIKFEWKGARDEEDSE